METEPISRNRFAESKPIDKISFFIGIILLFIIWLPTLLVKIHFNSYHKIAFMGIIFTVIAIAIVNTVIGIISIIKNRDIFGIIGLVFSVVVIMVNSLSMVIYLYLIYM